MTDSLAENFQGLSLSISHSEDREDITQAKDATVIDAFLLRIDKLSREVSRLLEKLYEIEEIRHGSNDSSSLQPLLVNLDASISAITGELESVRTEAAGARSTEVGASLERLQDGFADLKKQHAALQREMEEDGWLSRFNGTAEQANAMIDPIEASLVACSRYVETIASSPVPVPKQSDLPELLSLGSLQEMMKRHDSMRRVYTPSIDKILRMMGKSINDRETKNGVMLRRYDEMTHRWKELQRGLQQLDVRVRIVLNRKGMEESVETLNSPPNTYVTPGKTSSHRSSFSSGTSQPSSKLSSQFLDQPLRRKSSFVSATSSSTAKTVERPSVTKTPTNRRVSPVSRPTAPSPTPSSTSLVSRIPVASPVPRLSLDYRGDEEILQTPSRPRASEARSSMTVPRASLTPSFARSMTAPRSRGPPSSFRAVTPTPSNRPSSRMSLASYAPSAVAPVNLKPFQPSPYDLLDTHVQSVIQEVGFDLFVSRLDQPLRKGQRKRDDEEWKGEFVFGAGQRTSSVKLLKLAGRGGDAQRVKCLVRVQGAWQDLKTVLEKRKV